MALPPLTPDERAAALEKGTRMRKERAEVKASLKKGAVSLSEVLKDAKTSDVTGKIKVSDLLKSMPGVGEVRARQLMEQIGIAETRRARGLGAQQYAALEAEFATV
jgi:predicted flap endonuclease-1-like 5' DNA nuclease